MTVRFLFIQSHYSSETDISIKSLHDAEKGLRKTMNALDYISKMDWNQKTIQAEIEKDIQLNLTQVVDNLCDDFNTAKAIANLFVLSSHINTLHHQTEVGISEEVFNQLKKIYSDIVINVFGLTEEASTSNQALDATMNLIIELRKNARADKNWGLSDQIRDALKTAGIIIKDAKDGTTSYEIEN